MRLRRGRRALPLAALAALVALAAAALLLRLPATAHSRHLFPGHPPAAVAQLLADFTTHPHVGSWRVQSDDHNYTWWRYSVSFECGARCAGRALVEALELHAAAPRHSRHGAAQRHAVRLQRSVCTVLPLLPWPALCEEIEVHAEVTGDGAGGAVLEERARAHCAALLALSGVCAARLCDLRRQHLQRLRLELP